MISKRWRMTAAVIWMLAAGICYSCGKSPEGLEDEALLIAGEDAASEAVQSEAVTVPRCYVHICGAVKRPGVYELEEGSRVFQAVEQAGGFLEDAAADYLNMADSVTDGMKLVVPFQSEAEAGPYGPDALTAEGGADTKININTADKETLMTLRGIGESKAEDIIKYREESGGFQRIEDIMNVSGIKDAAFEKIKEDIKV